MDSAKITNKIAQKLDGIVSGLFEKDVIASALVILRGNAARSEQARKVAIATIVGGPQKE